VRRTELPGAEVPALLDVKIFWQRRNFSQRISAQLPHILQDDLRAAVVFLYLAVNLDNLAGELTHVTDFFQI
jgi:hypothetical protein